MQPSRGRPRKADSDARRHEFLRLVASGVPGDEAARQARITDKRAVAILSPLAQSALAKAA